MSHITIPEGYQSLLGLYDTQKAIGLIKTIFQEKLCMALHLKRVTAPLFVMQGSGLNDDLNGVERPVSFDVPSLNEQAEVVHSLAKWKRYALYKYGFRPGQGIVTDMNAVRRDEELDNLHSIYVDQWDWERVITADQRTLEFLQETVRDIVDAVCATSDELRWKFPELKNNIHLGREVAFITTQELEDRLNLQLTPGIYGLLGPNGAGKSTLMKLICMLIQPTDGIVLFDGEDIRMHRNNFLDRLGYMPQHSCLYPDFTVQEYLYYVGSLKGMHKKEVALRAEELLLRTRLIAMKKDKIQTLSGGMQQRLMFAQALLNDPEILILDEPTAGLDPQKRLELRNLIAEYSKDKIILLATHIVSDIELIASQILLLKKGKLIKVRSEERHV